MSSIAIASIIIVYTLDDVDDTKKRKRKQRIWMKELKYCTTKRNTHIHYTTRCANSPVAQKNSNILETHQTIAQRIKHYHTLATRCATACVAQFV